MIDRCEIAGKNKEQPFVPGIGHTYLYDNFDKISLYSENLK